VGRPKPKVTLSGGTAAFAEKLGVVEIDVSLTHSRGLAAAVAVVQLRSR
jgi:phosphopantetheinyl transferase (holo-ACP synthase)